jgi:hypothetical protein
MARGFEKLGCATVLLTLSHARAASTLAEPGPSKNKYRGIVPSVEAVVSYESNHGDVVRRELLSAGICQMGAHVEQLFK